MLMHMVKVLRFSSLAGNIPTAMFQCCYKLWQLIQLYMFNRCLVLFPLERFVQTILNLSTKMFNQWHHMLGQLLHLYASGDVMLSLKDKTLNIGPLYAAALSDITTLSSTLCSMMVDCNASILRLVRRAVELRLMLSYGKISGCAG